ncbi:hypothetical protein BZG84_14095 [Salinivibrio sp. PR932]|nr:hypothetical protein BZG84_14095 [Salinivibrio sp. PR932]
MYGAACKEVGDAARSNMQTASAAIKQERPTLTPRCPLFHAYRKRANTYIECASENQTSTALNTRWAK